MDDDEIIVVFMGVVDGGVHGAGYGDVVVDDAEFVMHQT